jgi:hypothetical protein
MTTAPWISPDLNLVLDRLTDVQILALTLFGEARSEPVEGIVAVGCVIRNRVTADLGGDRKRDWWGEGYRGVCLAPYQFSMWHRFPGTDGADRNYDQVLVTTQRMANGEQIGGVMDECLWVATGISANAIRDRARGCTHYHSVRLLPRPVWARAHAPLLQVGGHLFYAGVQ